MSSENPTEAAVEIPKDGRLRASLEDWYLSIKDDPHVGGDAAAAWFKRAKETVRSNAGIA